MSVVECQETVAQQKVKAQQHALIQQVDAWECNAMNQIRQTAAEARRLILEHTTDRIRQIGAKLVKLTEQLRECDRDNNFIANNVSQWQEELVHLSKQLTAPSSITVREVASPLVTKIIVNIPALLSIPNIVANAKWIQNGTTVAGGHGKGNRFNQLSVAHGLYLDDDQTIYVTDYSNHRVMEWKSGARSGQVVAGGNGSGNNANQLNHPIAVIVDKQSDSLIISDLLNKRVVRWPRRNGATGETIIEDIYCYGLAMDNSGYLYASDYSKHEVKRWKIGEPNGKVVAGGNGQGNKANQLNTPAAVIVDKQTDSLIISDYGNKRVVRWPRRNGTTGETIIPGISCLGLATENYGYLYVSDYIKHEVKRWKIGETNGTVVAGGNQAGNRLDQLSNPGYIFVDQDHSVYVSDHSNHRVVKWMDGAKEGIIVAGGQGSGNALTQLCYPRGIVIDQLGTVYVADYSNYRVMRWPKGATQGSVVAGGNGAGTQPNQFNGCWDLSFDRKNNLFVSDPGNHRVQKFNIDSNSIQ